MKTSIFSKSTLLVWMGAMSFFSFSHNLFAQGDLAQIKGQLLNQNQEAAIFSTISLFTSDSVFTKGAVSNETGNFTISGLETGNYYMVIENLEYNNYYSPEIQLAAGQKLLLESIVLENASQEIAEVTVTAERPLFEVYPDKIVFNVASSVNASGKNGLELLRKAPGVMVDPDNNVLLQGQSGVRIFINGRPSRLSGADLTTMLQSMQSDNIESIEVITNPSAKYEAEGNGGIINIQLKNNINLGYNGNIIHNYSIGKASRMSNGATLNYGKGKLGFTASITHFDNIFAQGFSDNRIQESFDITLNNSERQKEQGFNISTSITYTINDKHSVNFSGGGILTDGDYTIDAVTDISREAMQANDQVLISRTLTDLNSYNLNYNLNHQWKLSESSSLSTDLSYGSFVNNSRIYQPNTYFEADGTTETAQVNNGFDPDSDIDLYSIKTDYEKTFKKVAISAGAKYYQVETVNDFIVSNVIEGNFIVDDERSNTFSYTEKVAAAYLTGKFTLSKYLKADIGLRVENTASEGILESTFAIENSNVTRNYTNFFPNVGMAYNKGKTSISAGYGRRITRPNYQQLNPFEYKESELFIWKGNPFLNPAYVTNYQLTYSFDKALVISNTYSVTSNYFAVINEVEGAISRFVPQNMRNTTNYGLSISYPLQIAKWWEASYYVTYNRRTYEGDFAEATIDLDANIYSATTQNTFKLPWGLTLDLTAFYNSPWIWRGSVEIDAYSGVDIGLKKMFLDDKLQLIVTGNDIFNGYTDYPYFGEYGGMTMQGIRSFDNRRVGFGLTYKFGNQKIRAQQQKGGLKDELNRIE